MEKIRYNIMWKDKWTKHYNTIATESKRAAFSLGRHLLCLGVELLEVSSYNYDTDTVIDYFHKELSKELK